MANAFAITVDADAIQLDEDRKPAKIAFTVTNKCGQALAARARVLVEEPTAPDWIQIEGAAGEFIDRDFHEDETHQYTVTVSVPTAAASGSYKFRLHVESVDLPDEYWGQSPEIRVDVPEPKPIEKKKFPWWIVAVAAGVVVIVVGLLLWSPWSNGDDGGATITFAALPDGTQITADRMLMGDEFSAQGILVAAAPETDYCSEARDAAIRVRATPANFLTTASPGETNRCNTVLLEIVFTSPVRSLELTFFGAATVYVLRSYDSGNSLLQTVERAPSQVSQVERIRVAESSATIKRVTFGRQQALTAVTEIRFER